MEQLSTFDQDCTFSDGVSRTYLPLHKLNVLFNQSLDFISHCFLAGITEMYRYLISGRAYPPDKPRRFLSCGDSCCICFIHLDFLSADSSFCLSLPFHLSSQSRVGSYFRRSALKISTLSPLTVWIFAVPLRCRQRGTGKRTVSRCRPLHSTAKPAPLVYRRR